jgi:two-component system sensor histidine kinase HydH
MEPIADPGPSILPGAPLLDLLSERVVDPFRRQELTVLARQGRFEELARRLLDDPDGIPPRQGASDAEELLRGLLDGIQAGLAVVDTDLRVLFGGRAGEKPGPAEGACYEALFSRREPCSFCLARDVFERGEPRRTVAEMERPGGGSSWFEVLAFPLRGPDGDVRHVIELTRDVTRERELEGELRRSEQLAAVGRLAAGIAHEIKNPLGIILSSVDVLANPDRPREQRAEAEELLRLEVGRLSAIVSDFLSYARPPAPRLRERNLGRIVDRTASFWQRDPDRSELRVEIAPDLPSRPVDADQVHQALLNLLLNAAEAAGPSGHVAVRVRAAEDDRVEVLVEDDGPGLTPETRARAFEPFFTTRPRGSGLGLAIVRQVVSAHGGTVEARDRPGGGTVFRLVF